MSVMIEEPERRDMGGQITRRDLLISCLAAVMWRPRSAMGQARVMAQSGQSQLPVRVSTLNHVSFGCADLARTVAWYERVLAIPRYAFQDYGGGGGGQTVLRVGSDSLAYMALSQRDPESFSTPPIPASTLLLGYRGF